MCTCGCFVLIDSWNENLLLLFYKLSGNLKVCGKSVYILWAVPDPGFY